MIKFANHLYVVSIMFFSVLLSACCPPYCPISEPYLPLQPEEWDEYYQSENYDALYDGASSIVDEGEASEYYAEALLYSGLAELNRGGDVEVALDHFNEAEERIEQLESLDLQYEITLLYRGQMRAYGIIGDFEMSEIYLEKATGVSPELEDEIWMEYEDVIE